MNPYQALAEETAPISGLAITECLMQTVGAPEFNTRPAPSPSGTWIVNELGTEEQEKAYGHLWLVFGVSEPIAGSEPAALIYNAKSDPEIGRARDRTPGTNEHLDSRLPLDTK